MDPRTELRILWASNSPWVPSAFGKTTREYCQRLKARGYDIMCAGMQNQCTLQWNGLTVLGRIDHQFFQDVLDDYMRIYDRNLLISHINLWAISWLPDRWPDIARKWVPYVPIEGELDRTSFLTLEPAKKALATAATSRFGQEQFARHVRRSYLLHNGVDPDVFHPLSILERQRLRRQMGIGEDDFCIGNMGVNIYDRKDFPRLLKVFKLFADRVGRDKVWLYLHTNVVGTPEKSFPISLLAERYGIRDRVKVPRFDPRVRPYTDHEMCSMMNTFDIYFSVSRGEAFNVPLLEALACGVPAIVSDIPAHRELVAENKSGLFIRSNDSTVLLYSGEYFDMPLADVNDAVDRLEWAFHHRARLMEMGAYARDFARLFDYDRLVDTELVPMLEELAPLVNPRWGRQLTKPTGG